MTARQESNSKADELLHPYLAAQSEAKLRQLNLAYSAARFMYFSSVLLSIAYAGFICVFIFQDKSIGAGPLILAPTLILVVANCRKRFLLSRSNLVAYRSPAAT